MVLERVADGFTYVKPGHPFYAGVARFKALCADPPLRETIRALDAFGEPEVRSTLRGWREADGAWQFRGISLSLQFPAGGFQALTLIYSGKTNALKRLVFPEDPYLTSLARYVDGGRVLRYIPRRRLTFRTSAGIGKCVRREETAGLVRRLAAISEAAREAGVHFAVPAPLWAREKDGVFFQRELPGRPLSGLLGRTNFGPLLSAAGAIHRELHRLPVEGIPEFDPSAFIQGIEDGMDWVACFRPEIGPLLAEVRELLRRKQPAQDRREYVFCHGDFSCNQILHDGRGWSVVDFDDCLLADPHMEVASAIAFLKYDVPAFRRLFADPDPASAHLLESASAAYRQGYQGALDPDRLLWYRLCFELDYMARLFRRDRFDETSFGRAADLVRALSERYRKGDF